LGQSVVAGGAEGLHTDDALDVQAISGRSARATVVSAVASLTPLVLASTNELLCSTNALAPTAVALVSPLEAASAFVPNSC
jgi:hypothetical protein